MFERYKISFLKTSPYLPPLVLSFFVLFYSLLLLPLPSRSQVSFQDFLNEKKKITIPFEKKGNLIVVDVLLDEVYPLKFILDTGSPYTILFDKVYADFLNIPYSDTIRLAGADQSIVLFGHIARKVKLGLKPGKTAKRDIIILTEDYFKLKHYIGYEINGILGMDFFKSMLVKINFRRNRITFSMPSNKITKRLKQHYTYPIKLYKGKPFVTIPIQIDRKSTSRLDANFLIDTGAGLGLMLLNGSHPIIHLPKKHIRGFIGAGLGGVVKGYLSRIHRYDFGGLSYNNALCYFQTIDSIDFLSQDTTKVRHGILGTKLLSNYETIFNFSNNTLYLKPYTKTPPSFRVDKSGLLLYAGGKNFNKFIVGDVLEHSPAAQSGIKPGDQIIRVGWFPASYYTLSKLTKLFSGREGKKIRLTINRNGKKMKKHFRLQKLI